MMSESASVPDTAASARPSRASRAREVLRGS